jgi:glutathione S-transferase
MKIYGFPLSPFVRKVMVVAQEKGVEYELVPANPAQPTDEFLACSPYSKIPAIDDGGFTLADSTAIAVYLDAKHPEPALLPADPQARAKAVWFDEVADTVVMPAGAPMLFNRLVGPKFLGQPGDEAAAQAAERAIAERLGYIERTLGQDGWLDGAFSLGDIAVASVLRSFAYANWTLDEAAFPKITAWYGRITARPAWQAVAETERQVMAGVGL